MSRQNPTVQYNWLLIVNYSTLETFLIMPEFFQGLVSISISGFLWCGVYDSSTSSACKSDLPRGSSWIFAHIFHSEKYSCSKLNILAISTEFLWTCVCVYEIYHFSAFQMYIIMSPNSLEGVVLPLLTSSLH